MTKAPIEAHIFQNSGETFRPVKNYYDLPSFNPKLRLNWRMSFEPDKVRLMKQSVSLEQLNMDIYHLYQKSSPRKQTIMFGLLEILGALSPFHIMKKMLMLIIARGSIHVYWLGSYFIQRGRDWMNSVKRIETIHFGHESSAPWQANIEKCFKKTKIENLNCHYTYTDQTDTGYQDDHIAKTLSLPISFILVRV